MLQLFVALSALLVLCVFHVAVLLYSVVLFWMHI